MIFTFWHFLYYLEHLQVTCVATNHVAVPYPFTYYGNCVQAFLLALQSHGTVGWAIYGQIG